MYNPGYYLEELRRTTKTSVRIASVPHEIRTEHLLNISLQQYQYTNPHSEIDKWLQRTVCMGPKKPTTGLQGSAAQSVGNTGIQETLQCTESSVETQSYSLS